MWWRTGNINQYLAKRYWQKHIFYAGNVNLHTMTKVGDHQLRVDIEDWDGHARYALYNTFNVGDTRSKYKLSVGGYSGNAGKYFVV